MKRCLSFFATFLLAGCALQPLRPISTKPNEQETSAKQAEAQELFSMKSAINGAEFVRDQEEKAKFEIFCARAIGVKTCEIKGDGTILVKLN